MNRYLGIDFSGGAGPWKVKCKKPTVWIATVQQANAYILSDLRPVQELEGSGEPFERLVNFLKLGNFAAAAIDAPFALPARHMPNVSYLQFLKEIRVLPHGLDRPFPRGATLVTLGELAAAKTSSKPYRATEKHWIDRGVNTRSTMWNGPRGGAPFTAACLSLLSRIERPIWPWHPASTGMLVEAFPSAQLRFWGLPHQGYTGNQGTTIRQKIIEFISSIVKLDVSSRNEMLNSPDALDAVICCFAATAVSTEQFELVPHNCEDGMIAVLKSTKLF